MASPNADDYSPHKINLLEVKCDQSLVYRKPRSSSTCGHVSSTLLPPLTLAEYKRRKLKIVKCAYVDGADGAKISESVNDYNHISVLKLIIMKIEL
jgi:hypothetical protein